MLSAVYSFADGYNVSKAESVTTHVGPLNKAGPHYSAKHTGSHKRTAGHWLVSSSAFQGWVTLPMQGGLDWSWLE